MKPPTLHALAKNSNFFPMATENVLKEKHKPAHTNITDYEFHRQKVPPFLGEVTHTFVGDPIQRLVVSDESDHVASHHVKAHSVRIPSALNSLVGASPLQLKFWPSGGFHSFSEKKSFKFT